MSGRIPGNHLTFLDGARGLAALYVVMHHAWITAYPRLPQHDSCDLCRASPLWLNALVWGQLAVAVFIVVSGFSLALAPLRNGDRLVDGFHTYIVRRGFRILPPYWAALIVSCLAIALLTGSYSGSSVTARSLVVHALLVQNLTYSSKINGAFWSIAVEWQIYFLFPLLLLLWRRYGGLTTVCTTAVTVLLVYAAGAHHAALAQLLAVDPREFAPASKLLYLRPHFLLLFALGVAAAHVLVANGRMRSVPWTGVGIMMATATACVLWWLPMSQVEPAYFWIDLLAGSSAAALFAGCAQQPHGMAARILGSRVPRWLGQSSYSLYLMHVPVLEFAYFVIVAPHLAGSHARFCALIALAVPMAVLVSRGFWRFVELPFMKARAMRDLRVMVHPLLLVARHAPWARARR